MHVVEMIAFWGKACPDRLALVSPKAVLNYRSLAQSIESVAHHLASLKLDKREAIAVALDDPLKLLPVCLALLRLGHAVAPLPEMALAELASLRLATSISLSRRALVSTGPNIFFEDSWLLPLADMVSRHARADQYGDLILFTSGTTGVPKKIVHRNRAIQARYELSAVLGYSNYRCMLIVPGVNSGIGFHHACEALLHGLTACLAPVSEALLQMISTFKVEYMFASPSQAQALCELAGKRPQYDLCSLAAIRLGGAYVSQALARRVQAQLCRHVIVNYASTEAWVAAAAPYDAIADIPSAVGVLMPWTELEIVDEDGRRVPDGREGHVRLRTPVFVANQDDANGDASGKRWFYPGDIGSLTADRILCIQGRADEVINRGGVKILPAVLEDALQSRPGVKDAAICAAPGTQAQELWIAVVADKNFSMPAIRQFVATTYEFRIGSRSGTETIFVVTDIPRTELGKVKRHELCERLAALKERHRVLG